MVALGDHVGRLQSMYPLPGESELQFLVGRTLEQVCVGAHSLRLSFDNGVTLTIQSSLTLISTDGTTETLEAEEYRQSASAIARLIDGIIEQVRGDDSNTLHIRLANGKSLVLHEMPGPFESYTIDGGPTGLIVV